MKYIKDLKEDEMIREHYLCKQKQILKTRAGKSYLSLKLQDKTGTIDAKVWDLHAEINEFSEYEFIKVEAVVISYQGENQLNVRKIRKSTEGEYDPKEYFPITEKDIDEMYGNITKYINSVNNKYMKALLKEFFVNDKDIKNAFMNHSAAKSMHHEYLGGLLEHTLSVVDICEFMSKQYKDVNRDLLITTALLHDIGKIKELSSFPRNDYTDIGQLMGHITIGIDMITKKIMNIEGFPENIEHLIKHSILAHHGEYEYGSPKLPHTIEAMILHVADNADAKIKMFQKFVNEEANDGEWVGYQKSIGRNIRKTKY